jgi:hypothetical protein
MEVKDMKIDEKEVLMSIKEQYREMIKDSNNDNVKISFLFQGIMNGINICVKNLNFEVSEDFLDGCNKFLDKLIEKGI